MSKKSRFQAVWFDLDGTLLDTAEDLMDAVIAAAQAGGCSYPDKEKIRAQISGGSKSMLAAALNIDTESKRIEQLLAVFRAHYAKQTSRYTDYFPGMAQIITQLDAKKITWGIVTNKLTQFAEAVIRDMQLTNRIAALVCGDTCAYPKPHPAPLLYACKQARVEASQCVFIGDSSVDINAGRAAGMTTIACRYGYSAADDNPDTWGADGVIDSPAQLAEWLWM